MHIRGKKAEDLMYPIIIFVVLNLIFFSTLLIFVYKSSNGTLALEQVYSKEIALLIDGSEPGMEVSIDFSKPIKIAEENGLTSKEEMVSISSGTVTVKLSEKGGYAFNYFSNSEVQVEFNENNLVLKFNKK